MVISTLLFAAKALSSPFSFPPAEMHLPQRGFLHRGSFSRRRLREGDSWRTLPFARGLCGGTWTLRAHPPSSLFITRSFRLNVLLSLYFLPPLSLEKGQKQQQVSLTSRSNCAPHGGELPHAKQFFPFRQTDGLSRLSG